jgi:hypothetical protein
MKKRRLFNLKLSTLFSPPSPWPLAIGAKALKKQKDKLKKYLSERVKKRDSFFFRRLK